MSAGVKLLGRIIILDAVILDSFNFIYLLKINVFFFEHVSSIWHRYFLLSFTNRNILFPINFLVIRDWKHLIDVC
jgi:hypothetical protein